MQKGWVGVMQLKSESGIYSALYLILLVTLALLGIGASVLIKSEGKNTAVNVNAMQIEAAATGAAYYGIRALEQGSGLDEQAGLQIGGVTVTLDSAIVAGELHMRVQAAMAGVTESLLIRMRPLSLSDFAVYLEGGATNINTQDSLGVDDPEVMADNVAALPVIDVATLYAMSTAQGHDQAVADFVAPDGYGVSFYQADGVTPNVHHISGDLTVLGGRSVYGIFVVDGSIDIAGAARVIGIIYVVNPNVTMILGGGNPSGASINGGIVSRGDLFGTGSHINIKHVPDYMRTFAQWSDPIAGFRVMAWEYL